jgi:hypothetical protein
VSGVNGLVVYASDMGDSPSSRDIGMLGGISTSRW